MSLGCDAPVLTDEFDAFLSFTVDDPVFDQGPEQPLTAEGLPSADAALHVNASNGSLNTNLEDAELEGLLLDDIILPEDDEVTLSGSGLDRVGVTGVEYPTPSSHHQSASPCLQDWRAPSQPLGSQVYHVGPTVTSSNPVLEPYQGQAPVSGPASPPRSTSSLSDGPGESLGSNEKTPDHGNSAEASAARGSSSDADPTSDGGCGGGRLSGAPKPEASMASPGGVSSDGSADQVGRPPSLAGPGMAGLPGMLGMPGMPGVPGAGNPSQMGIPGFPGMPGYRLPPHPGPMMFHPMMAFARSLPRRNRKSSAGTGGRGQAGGGFAKDKGRGGKREAREGTEGKEVKEGKGLKEGKVVPGSNERPEVKTEEMNLEYNVQASCSPQSGVSTEEKGGAVALGMEGSKRCLGAGSDSSEDGEGPKDEDWEKRQARLMRNRESAQLSRQRKKFYMEELEVQLRTMSATVAELNNTIAHLTAENVNLRRQLAYFCPQGANGAPGMPGASQAPGAFGGAPGVPGGPHMMGFRGLYSVSSPVVPIPKLKSSAKKAEGQDERKRKAEEAKGTQGSKAVEGPGKGGKKAKGGASPPVKASVAVLGLFGFLMLFSPLLPSTSFDTTGHGAPAIIGGAPSGASWSGLGSRALEAVFRLGSSPQWAQYTRTGKGQPARVREGRPSDRLLLGVYDDVGVLSNSSGREEAGRGRPHQLRGRATATVPGVPSLSLGGLRAPLPEAAQRLHRRKETSSGNSELSPSARASLAPGVASGRDSRTVSFSLRANDTDPQSALAATLLLQGAKGSRLEIDGRLIVNAVLAGRRAAAQAQTASVAELLPPSRGQRVSADRAIPLGPVGQATSGGGTPGAGAKRPSASAMVPSDARSPVEGPQLLQKLPGAGSELAVVSGGAVLHPEQLKHVVMGSLEKGKEEPQSAPVGKMWALPEKVMEGAPPRGADRKGSFPGDSWRGSFIASEMCTEVFQFEVTRFAEGDAEGNRTDSPEAANRTGKGHRGSSGASARQSRRLGLRQEHPAMSDTKVGYVPVPQAARSQPASHQPNSSSSSMVVSILAGVDAGEAARSSPSSGPKGVTKIFVVVLVDGIKYVTYACLMPTFAVSASASLIPV